MRILPFASSLVGFSLLAVSASAQAPAPAEKTMTISAAALVGYGLGDSDANAYKIGFGARAGVTLPVGVYLGGTFVYHLGESKTTPSFIGEIKTTFGVYYYGVEAGYDIKAGPVVIRPYLGLGQIKGHGEVCIGGSCSSAEGDAEIYMNPGAVVLFPVTSSVFLGGDVRYTRVVTGDGDKAKISAPGLFLTGGMNFWDAEPLGSPSAEVAWHLGAAMVLVSEKWPADAGTGAVL